MPYEGQRCSVWLIGVYCTQSALCLAHSKGHWLSGSLLWDSKSISKFLGGGPNFHAFNESRFIVYACFGSRNTFIFLPWNEISAHCKKIKPNS